MDSLIQNEASPVFQAVSAVDFFLFHPRVVDKFVVHFVHVHLIHVLAVLFINRVRVEYISRFVLACKLNELIRNDNTDRKRFDTHIFIRRNLFRIEKIIDIAVENV